MFIAEPSRLPLSAVRGCALEPMGRILGRIWVGATLCLISFIGFSSQLCVVLPSFDGDWTSRELLETVVPFNFLLALLFYNYFLCVFTDPGQVPVDWVRNRTERNARGLTRERC